MVNNTNVTTSKCTLDEITCDHQCWEVHQSGHHRHRCQAGALHPEARPPPPDESRTPTPLAEHHPSGHRQTDRLQTSLQLPTEYVMNQHLCL
jgi:hypothetical protein